MDVNNIALTAVDWSVLHHAYGRATDTPDHLRALATDDPERILQAKLHLWGSVLHQGSLYSATAPTALVIVKLLPFVRDLDTFHALRSFLSDVRASTELHDGNPDIEEWAALDIAPSLEFDGLWDGDEVARGNAFFSRAVLSCRKAIPMIDNALQQTLDLILNPPFDALTPWSQPRGCGR